MDDESTGSGGLHENPRQAVNGSSDDPHPDVVDEHVWDT